MTSGEYESILDALETAAKALERARDLATAAKERGLAKDIDSAAVVVADVIDELNETSIHE